MKSNADLTAIRKGLKRVALAWHPSVWLNTGIALLNNVAGHADKGIAYGRMIEISGWECLVGSTLIDTPRNMEENPQGIPIKDLVGKKPWVYGFDQTLERIVLRQASRVWKVGTRPVWKVNFSVSKNSVRVYGKQPEFILATASHPFMLRKASGRRSKFSPAYDYESQGYRALSDLKPGDRIMPFFRKRTNDSFVVHLNNGKDIAEHQFITSEIYGERNPKEWHSHHIDENRLNVSVDNLEWKEAHDHISYHTTKRNLAGTAGWQATGVHPRGMLGKTHTKPVRKRISETLKARSAKLNHRVKSIQYYGEEDVYDMEVPGINNFVANGVVVHNSAGKSAITLSLAALAQFDGAHVVWGDIENSFESDWALQRGCMKCPTCKGKDYKECTGCGYDPKDVGSEGCGLDTSRFTLIQPYVGYFDKETEPRLSTAQELLSEIEACIKLKRKEDRCFVVVDSITALETEEERNAGIGGANMKTNMSLSTLLGRILRRWVGLAQVHNALIIFINQLRSGPAKSKFSDPTYTTGGNAPRFYCHVRLRVKRVMGSKIVDKGKTIGIKGIIEAKKNKTGGEEGAKVGYRLFFRGKVEFVKASAVAPEKDKESE